jgi:hypothetical protein
MQVLLDDLEKGGFHGKRHSWLEAVNIVADD